MDNDKFQEQVLQQMQALSEGQRQTQDMVTQLVRIVGNTNAIVEELRADVTDLKTGQAKLEATVTELKAGQTKLEFDVAELKIKVGKMDVKLDHISEVLDVLAVRSIRQEAEIQTIKRAK